MHLREIILFFILIDCLSITVRAAARTKVEILSLNDNNIKNEWSSFKSKHKRLFRSTVAEEARLKIFKENLKKINDQNEKYNNGTSDYTSGINAFADMTSEEFRKTLGYKQSDFIQIMNSSIKFKRSDRRASIPASVDWRTSGYVNPIRNQGQCGSCWAFSAVAALEGQYFKATRQLLSFSEQQLVDCSKEQCLGGTQHQAYDYIKQNGITLQANYPYTSGSTGARSFCKNPRSSLAARVTGYVTIPTDNEAALTEAIATVGPIAVAMDFNKAQFYKSGIFTESSCSPRNINHAVTAVGYGTSNGQDYYILKNSHGDRWGDKGYMLLRRNYNSHCGIARQALYPLVEGSGSSTTSRTPTTTACNNWFCFDFFTIF